MCEAIETTAARLGVVFVKTYADDPTSIQWSRNLHGDPAQGRLWTQASKSASYEPLRRAIKTGAAYDKQSGLWVKRASWSAYEQYKQTRQSESDRLAQHNQSYAIEVLGGRIVSE